MKSVLKLALSLAAMFVATQSFAAFDATKLLAVTKLAVEDFQRDHADHAAHFIGYKAWKSGEDAKVKIYVNHNGTNMEFNYTCHEHDGTTECHGQH